MEMKQTAMEQLLHNLKNMGETIPSSTPDTTLMAVISAIVGTYLEKEKNQIVKAFNVGEMNYASGIKDDDNFEFEGGADYFEKYYKTLNDLI
tara:strand:+ start:7688 stop:7963 length:276 start_codon:yes stop_codon:yes gene_type:complete